MVGRARRTYSCIRRMASARTQSAPVIMKRRDVGLDDEAPTSLNQPTIKQALPEDLSEVELFLVRDHSTRYAHNADARCRRVLDVLERGEGSINAPLSVRPRTRDDERGSAKHGRPAEHDHKDIFAACSRGHPQQYCQYRSHSGRFVAVTNPPPTAPQMAGYCPGCTGR